ILYYYIILYYIILYYIILYYIILYYIILYYIILYYIILYYIILYYIILYYIILNGNIPTSQSYNVFTFQLIRYARGCLHVQDFYDRVKILTIKLMNQAFKLCHLQKTYS